MNLLRTNRSLWSVWLLALASAWMLYSPCLAAEYEAFVYKDASGHSLPYRLLPPSVPSKEKKYPLVVFFHGAGERGTDNQKQLVHGTGLFLRPEVREKYPCYVVAPQCPENQQWVDMPWGTEKGTRSAVPSASMQLALKMIEQITREYPVDDKRIYVTGLSMGGYATWDCITRFPKKFAAAVPICGGGDESTVSPNVARVPVWAFHSEDDGAVKVIRTRNMVRAIRLNGGAAKYYEYFWLGHNCWEQAYNEPELLPWLFSQQLGKRDRYVLSQENPTFPEGARWPISDEMFPGQGPLQKADWFRNLWRERRARWWYSRSHEQGTVVFLGDSITQGWGSLQQDFPEFRVVNRGISGDVTRGVRYRLKEDVIDLNPAAVVMLIGTNDLGLQGEPEPAAENIRVILDTLRENSPKMPIIVCKVMPRQPSLGAKVQRLNELVDQFVARDPLCVRCDTWSLFEDGQGGAKKEEFPDLLHPNAAGYAKWTAALQPILRQCKVPTKTSSAP